MKVLLLNGSPHRNGCTHTALLQVAKSIEAAGIGTDLIDLGPGPVKNCTVCRACKTTTPNRCCFSDDPLNSILDQATDYHGLVLGSPVHFASACGLATSFFDRLFFAGGSLWAGKAAAAVVTCRRSGGSAALDQLNRYFSYHRMIQVGSQYWNIIHGNNPEEIVRDEEGLQILRTLGQNIAWQIAAAASAAPFPLAEKPVKTNFIR